MSLEEFRDCLQKNDVDGWKNKIKNINKIENNNDNQALMLKEAIYKNNLNFVDFFISNGL